MGIDLGNAVVLFIVLLFSLTVHEAAHAWTASRLGDQTARMLGRVSLNPLVHIDPIGTVLFPLIALVTGVPLLGWAKPVPVTLRNLHGNWKQKYMAIAAAGPASNVLIAIAAAVLLRVMVAGGLAESESPAISFALALFGFSVQLNIMLAVFNMIPIPPLDGGNVLAGLLRGRAAELFDGLRQYGFIILYGLMYTGVLSRIMGPPMRFIQSLLL